MNVQRSEWFIADLEHYAVRYDQDAGWEIARRYLQAVSATLDLLARMPAIGAVACFAESELAGIRFFPVERPFDKHMIFYRIGQNEIIAERIVHGMRDLPKRLVEPPT